MLARLILLTSLALTLSVTGREAIAQTKQTSPEEVFQQAFDRFRSNNYEDAADKLRGLLNVPIDAQNPKHEERAKLYLEARPILVACLYGIAAVSTDEQKKDLYAEADAVILAQYRQNPFFKLPAGYSDTVTDRWSRVYFENEKELEALKNERVSQQREAEQRERDRQKKLAARIDRLEAMASEENFVETRSRVVAAIPFGVGQFQNDDIGWGVFFAASEAIFITSSIVSFAIADSIKDIECPGLQEDEETNELRPVDCEALMTNFQIARGVNYASLATTGLLIIGGIIQAQIAFEPERTTTRKRDIPPPVSLEPTAIVTPEGGYFGVQGRF